MNFVTIRIWSECKILLKFYNMQNLSRMINSQWILQAVKCGIHHSAFCKIDHTASGAQLALIDKFGKMQNDDDEQRSQLHTETQCFSILTAVAGTRKYTQTIQQPQ